MNTTTTIDDKALAKRLAKRDAERLRAAHDPHSGEGSKDPRDHHEAAEHLAHDGHRPEIYPKDHGEVSLKRDGKLIDKYHRAMRKGVTKMRDAGKARAKAKAEK
jgi:hypothetical protein